MSVNGLRDGGYHQLTEERDRLDSNTSKVRAGKNQQPQCIQSNSRVQILNAHNAELNSKQQNSLEQKSVTVFVNVLIVPLAHKPVPLQ